MIPLKWLEEKEKKAASINVKSTLKEVLDVKIHQSKSLNVLMNILILYQS